MTLSRSRARTTPAVPDSVVHAQLDAESVLLNVETGVYFGLNPVGDRIWQLASTGATEDEIVARLRAEYEVEPERLRADVAHFLARLAAKGLLIGVASRSSG